jgi:predicted nucleic acid-binding Zn ribbon protein
MTADLAEIRQDIIGGRCPVLMDAADAAIALDRSAHSVREDFDNMVMAGDRWLVRAAEVRDILVAMQPKPKAPAPRLCLSCEEPLQLRQRRFCSTRCSELTPTGRARLREAKALQAAAENPRETAGVSIPPLPETGRPLMGAMGALSQAPDALNIAVAGGQHAA